MSCCWSNPIPYRQMGFQGGSDSPKVPQPGPGFLVLSCLLLSNSEKSWTLGPGSEGRPCLAPVDGRGAAADGQGPGSSSLARGALSAVPLWEVACSCTQGSPVLGAGGQCPQEDSPQPFPSTTRREVHRHTSRDYLCFALLRLCGYLQIEGLWQPSIRQAFWHHFPDSICSLHVSMSHFDNSKNISNFFIRVLFVRVICAQGLWLSSDDG